MEHLLCFLNQMVSLFLIYLPRYLTPSQSRVATALLLTHIILIMWHIWLHCYICRPVGRQLNNQYGAGTGHIWLDDVRCNGTETSLDSCSHSPWGTNDCGHDDDISVSCNADVGAPNATTNPSSWINWHSACWRPFTYVCMCSQTVRDIPIVTNGDYLETISWKFNAALTFGIG